MIQKFPQGGEENTFIRMVISYWDMVASIVNRGLINDELFFESNGEIWVVWDRMHTIVPIWRSAFKNPQLFSNIEDTCKRLEAWREKKAPGSSAAMRQMMDQARQKNQRRLSLSAPEMPHHARLHHCLRRTACGSIAGDISNFAAGWAIRRQFRPAAFAS